MAQEHEVMNPDRIQSLTDGIYAIAMTILVLGLKVPQTAQNSKALTQGLLDMELRFSDMATSFFVLAIFWTIHHRHFDVIRRVDTKLVWLNLFSFLFVIMIPFSTTLYSEYHNVVVASLFLNCNILVLGLLKFWHWTYATHDNRLVDIDLTRRAIIRGRVLNAVSPLVATIAVGVSFISPGNSTILYILIPVFIFISRRKLAGD